MHSFKNKKVSQYLDPRRRSLEAFTTIFNGYHHQKSMATAQEHLLLLLQCNTDLGRHLQHLLCITIQGQYRQLHPFSTNLIPESRPQALNSMLDRLLHHLHHLIEPRTLLIGLQCLTIDITDITPPERCHLVRRHLAGLGSRLLLSEAPWMM